MKLARFILGILLLAVGFGSGLFWATLRRAKTTTEPSATTATMVQTKVVAQGNILPVSGLINIYAPPNQRIEKILVQEGETISANAELASFNSQATLELQSEMVDSQGEDAKRELEQKILAAEGNLMAAQNAVIAAKLQIEQVQSDQSLAVSEQQLDTARDKLIRMEQLANDVATRLYVSQTNLTDQKNSIRQAESQLKSALQQRDHAITAAKLNLEAAEKTHVQVQSALATLRALEKENRTLQLTKSIAETTTKNARLVSPVSATVLRINGKPGEVMLHSPLMQLGDLSNLVCVAEVIDRLAHHVRPGQLATITSPALPDPIQGKVTSVSRIVGNGILSDPNPLAVMDGKTVEVKIELDLTAEQIVDQLINLQVTVEIGVPPQPDSIK